MSGSEPGSDTGTGSEERPPAEIAWFGALCDDDYRHLGVVEDALRSSWEHCASITLAADGHGFDNILLPSGYSLGIDSVAFAAGIAPQLAQMHLLVAVRCGELVVPQMARQLATLDQMLGGRLTINIISSELPGESLASEPRYQRTREVMAALRDLLDRRPVRTDGDFVALDIDPPRIGTVSGTCPPFYFGGMSEPARETAAAGADVFLMWPDTMDKVAGTMADITARAERHGRRLRFGYRAHVIVRETESQARDAAAELLSELDAEEGERIRQRSLDSASAGVARQAALREGADDEGWAEDNLWTGIGRARSGAGAAIVGDPDQVAAKIEAYRDLGIEAFILSGYPHRDECDLFARHVLPKIDHAPFRPRWEASGVT